MKSGKVVFVILLVGSTVALGRAQGIPCERTAPSVSEPCKDEKATRVTDQKARNQKAKQSRDEETPPSINSLGRPLLKNLAADQKAIWTSPSRVRPQDATWLVPLGGLTAALFVTDRQFSKHLSNSPHRLDRSSKVSDLGAAALVGGAGGLYLWGKIAHDEHKRETGFLSGEALLNALAVTSLIQIAAGRERPFQGGGRGNFFHHGTSFPSNHAAAAWSLAGVIAHEYPGPLTKLLAYGMASAVSISRLSAKEHFSSDVLIGSAIGWFIGQRVYRAHHDPGLRGSTWATPAEVLSQGNEETHGAMGSPFVPLDSWVYPAMERMAGMGYVRSAMTGLKPWTRTECARLIEEAGEQIRETLIHERNVNNEGTRLFAALEKEFAPDMEVLGGGPNRSAQVESVYSRATSISGPPLTDALHFGQTISYDFGRPFRRGFNNVTGASAYVTSGRFAIYVRGEYQHSPGAPALPSSVANLNANLDVKPVETPHPFRPINRPRLLDAYITFNLANVQFSFGQQSLEWGVGEGNSLLLSHNAEPLPMFRVTNVVPKRMPWIFKWLGPVRTEFFFSRLDGLTFNPRPYFYGQKISVKPTRRLELGIGRTTEIGGRNYPVTLRLFIRSFFNAGSGSSTDANDNPGDSRVAWDFSYLLPGFKDTLTLYAELFQDDQISPFVGTSEMAHRSGLYFSRLPGLPKMDFRIEAASTESPGRVDDTGKPDPQHLNYWNFQFRDGYIYNGFLLGNTVGRMGRSIQVKSRYWLSPKQALGVRYRHNSISPIFISGGGQWSDCGLDHQKIFGSRIYLRSKLQVERIRRFPALFVGSRMNVTASIEMGFMPERLKP